MRCTCGAVRTGQRSGAGGPGSSHRGGGSADPGSLYINVCVCVCVHAHRTEQVK